MDIKEAIRAVLKDMILPELEYIRKDHQELKVQMELTNKRLDDMNRHLVDQSRRIDETNNRFEETNKRIDRLNQTINLLTFYAEQTCEDDYKTEELLEEILYKDILLRIQRLEDKVMGA